MLCDRFPYFEAAFKSDFKEGKEKTMELPKDNPNSFAKFVDWVYTGRLECARCDANANNGGSTFRYADELHDLCWIGLWLFADKIGVPDLSNLTLGRYGTCLWNGYKCFSAKAVQFVYEATAETSAVRKELVELTISRYYGYLDGPYGVDEQEELKTLRKLASSHEDFTKDFLEELQEHMKVAGKDCNYYMCRIHRSANLCGQCSEETHSQGVW